MHIRQRRASQVEIYVPISRYSSTPWPFRDLTIPTTIRTAVQGRRCSVWDDQAQLRPFCEVVDNDVIRSTRASRGTYCMSLSLGAETPWFIICRFICPSCQPSATQVPPHLTQLATIRTQSVFITTFDLRCHLNCQLRRPLDTRHRIPLHRRVLGGFPIFQSRFWKTSSMRSHFCVAIGT